MPVQFLRPELAAWLICLPLLAGLWLLHVRAKGRFRMTAGFGETMQSLSDMSSGLHDRVILAAGLLAGFAIVLAVMRPQLHIDRILPEYERQDLVLILDRSASMHARDVPPTRFVRAIEEIKAFLAEKPGDIDRVSLVGFAGTALTLSHLTRDLDTLYFFLDWIGEDMRVYFGTNLTGALTNALELVRKDEALDRTGPVTRKIFVVLSDGDDQSEQLIGLLNQMQQKQIRVHSIGIGSDTEVPIPVEQEDGEIGYLEDDEGNQLTTQFDETTLRMIADMTGGRYFRSTSGHELAGFIGDIVNEERRQIGLKRTGEFMELHIPLLVVAAFAGLILLVKI